MKTKIYTLKSKILSDITDLYRKYFGITSFVRYFEPENYIVIHTRSMNYDNGAITFNTLDDEYDVIYHEDEKLLELNKH